MASQLAEAHIAGERRLRELAAWGVGQAWTGLSAYDRQNIDQFLTVVVPLVAGAQRASIGWTDAYLAHQLGRPPLGVGADDLIENVIRPGVSLGEVYTRPFVSVWTALSENKPYEQAVKAGLDRATSTAATDVQMAARAAFHEVGEADENIYGYERAADAGACSFCQEVDGAYVKDGAAMPLHNHCGCSLEPLTEPHERAVNLPSGVAVHEHGELGATLGDPAHDFTSEAQIN